MHIETDPKAEKKMIVAADDESLIETLIETLSSASFKDGFKLSPIEFEKDDDTNFHMETIAGLANMRARNYQVRNVPVAPGACGRVRGGGGEGENGASTFIGILSRGCFLPGSSYSRLYFVALCAFGGTK